MNASEEVVCWAGFVTGGKAGIRSGAPERAETTMIANNRISLPIATLLLLVCGCASSRMALESSPAHRVIVDGEEVVTVGHENLLELLRRKATAYRLGEQAPADEQPLVVVDGITMMDGALALASIRAFHVASVSLLRQTEAVPVYGPRARKGAIIVNTRRGR